MPDWLVNGAGVAGLMALAIVATIGATVVVLVALVPRDRREHVIPHLADLVRAFLRRRP